MAATAAALAAAVRILVTGSRTWGFPKLIERALKVAAVGNGPHTLIVGDAAGADSQAYGIAATLGWNAEIHAANWEEEGRSAGIQRNLRMLDGDISVVCAFWDGASRGTHHCYTEALKRGIPVHLYIYPRP